ncbi:MAG: DNA-binding domain-containing protein [Spirochaetales bacterium]|nr:DNA-binding domain-containing protein [Spirochaetales bacterium]
MSKICYYLTENHLNTSEENQFMARLWKKDTKRQDDVIQHMMGKNTTITEHDILLVLNLMKESVMELVLDGYPVIMDLFKVKAGIRGGFSTNVDEYDKSRHQVVANVSASADFRKTLATEASVEKMSNLSKKPTIGTIYNYETGIFGTSFSAGDLIGLKGDYLKPEEGSPKIYLRQEGSEELIRVSRINGVTEKSIMCRLPEDLEKGNYTIKVVTGEADEEVNSKYGKLINIV